MDTTTKLKLVVPAIYALFCSVFFIITWPEYPSLYNFAGVATSSIAFFLWLLARVQLGNSFSIAPKADGLVQSGVYSKLRHPVYYFSILAVLGLAIYTWSPLGAVAVVLLIILELYRIRKEEAILTQKYGDTYVAYKNKTWF